MRFGHLPYNPVSDYYKMIFGQKVFKIPVSIAEDCPNRAGLKGMEVCIFCDEHGSFAYPQNQKQDLKRQIEMHKKKVAERFNSKKFLVYFQAYTTTFNQFKKIEDAFELALSDADTVGIIVGTRPDCLSDRLLDLWKHVSEQVFMGVELGVQSFDDRQLEWMKRGHTAADSILALQKISKRCAKVNLGIHLMFGWPGETLLDVEKAALICNTLPINNVKLHNLHVLKNTPLEKIFNAGEFNPLEFEAYCELVSHFLAHLNPEIHVHRLTAQASQIGELVAPEWTRFKMTSYQGVIDYMNHHKLYQGLHFKTSFEKVPNAGY